MISPVTEKRSCLSGITLSSQGVRVIQGVIQVCRRRAILKVMYNRYALPSLSAYRK